MFNKLSIIFLLMLTICFAEVGIRFKPQYNIGKMTNGNFYSEIVPLSILYTPIPEWDLGLSYSMGFESPRGNFSLVGNHRGWATEVKVQFKPLYWISTILPDLSIKDFAVSYTKQISDYYAGSTLDVGRLNYDDWEEISIGFDIEI